MKMIRKQKILMFFRLFGGNYTEKEKIRLYGLFMGQNKLGQPRSLLQGI
ncbi:MAG: hypothetical protein HFH42_00020 [Lachnospiraceae bacterium]|nr:hypothetical protein [Lachnospiraceae bacterium]